MRTGFKNFRRDHLESSPVSAPKKRKTIDIEETGEAEIEYQEAVDQMKAEYRKKKREIVLQSKISWRLHCQREESGLQKSAH